MSHIRRLRVLTFSFVLLAVAVCGGYFAPQVVMYFRIRSSLNDAKWRLPILHSVPKPLSGTAASTAEGTTLSYFGYRFEVPWTGIEREINEGRWSRVTFQGGQLVECFNPQYFQQDPIHRPYEIDPSMYDRAFEGTPKGSKYEQLRNVLSWTPAEFQPFCSHQAFARSFVLFTLKSEWFAHSVPGPQVHSVEAAQCRGFEMTTLRQKRQTVALRLFDAEDHWYQLNVSARETGVRITQPEINRIIQTFGPSPTKGSNPTEK
jgi:hypothetical protein